MQIQKLHSPWMKVFLFAHSLAWLAVIVLFVLLTPQMTVSHHTSDAVSSSVPAKNPEYGTIQMQNNAKTQAEMMQMLNEQVEKGMFHVFMNTEITVNRDGQANLYIQNIPNNHDACIVEIRDQQSNTLYYQSQTIRPGYKVESDQLAVSLPKGKYPCLATFRITDLHTNQPKNQIVLKVNLTVE